LKDTTIFEIIKMANGYYLLRKRFLILILKFNCLKIKNVSCFFEQI